MTEDRIPRYTRTVAAHSHTARALDWTTSPVTAPHPERTQGSAEEAIAADCDELH